MTARQYNLAATTSFLAAAVWTVTGIVLAAGDNAAATVAPNPHWLADGCKECHDPARGEPKSIPRQDIAEIIPRRTPPQIYGDEIRKRDLFDAGQAFELAAWCARDDVGLVDEATVLAHRVLRLDPGNAAVYPLLARLTEDGWLESRWEDSELPGRPRRQLYRLTAAGRVQAPQALERAQSSWLQMPDPREA